jgi:hypothetical protein
LPYYPCYVDGDNNMMSLASSKDCAVVNMGHKELKRKFANWAVLRNLRINKWINKRLSERCRPADFNRMVYRAIYITINSLGCWIAMWNLCVYHRVIYNIKKFLNSNNLYLYILNYKFLWLLFYICELVLIFL